MFTCRCKAETVFERDCSVNQMEKNKIKMLVTFFFFIEMLSLNQWFSPRVPQDLL